MCERERESERDGEKKGREDRGLHIDALKPHSFHTEQVVKRTPLLPSPTRFGIGFQPFGSNRVFLTAGERACFPVFLLSTLSWSSSTAGTRNRRCQLQLKGAQKVIFSFSIMEEPRKQPSLCMDQLFMTA